jgi:hypothetical protein
MNSWWDQLSYGTDDVVLTVTPVSPRMRNKNEEPNSKWKSCSDETSQEPQENGEKKRKFSRSASIVEEFESLLIPNPKIEKTFRKEKWDSLDQSWRDLCIECATSCCKYLNNIHFEKGKVWTCTVLRIGKVKPYSTDIDHVVMDIDCRPVDEKIAFSDEDVVWSKTTKY